MKPYHIVNLNGWLFLSNKLWPERDLPTLHALGIGAIVNLCEDHHYATPAGMSLLRAGSPDATWIPLSQLETIYDFIRRHRVSTRVLVHCSAGVSRSAGIVAGQLLLDHPNWSWDEALAKILVHRSVWIATEVRASVQALLATKRGQLDDRALDVGEADGIAAIERTHGESLPRVCEICWNSQGFIAEGGRVTGIGLCGVGLTRWPAAVSRLRHLRVLSLNDNAISVVPPDIAELGTLEQLDISGNHLVELPAEIAALRRLRNLNASRNLLERLPADLNGLEQLEELCLHRNRLECLPAEFGNLGALRELYLHENALRELPASLGALANLRRLGVSNNAIVELPETIGTLQGLNAFGLGKNRLRRLPETLGQLTALDNLNLSSNRLRDLPRSVVRLRNVRRLNLALNEIDSLSPEQERWLTELQAGGAIVYRDQVGGEVPYL